MLDQHLHLCHRKDQYVHAHYLTFTLRMSWPEFYVDQSSSSTQIDENSLKVRVYTLYCFGANHNGYDAR